MNNTVNDKFTLRYNQPKQVQQIRECYLIFMLRNKTTDIFANVVLPIVVGIVIYKFGTKWNLSNLFINYLPDGMWAYAFISSILIIWKRTFNYIWLATAFLIFILFETFQYFKIINGTADFKDVIIYFSFGLISLLTNKFYNNQNKHYE